LAADPSLTTDPYDSVYRLVFQFTMRTVACDDIANDPPLLAKCLRLFEIVEGASTSWLIMYPFLPLWAKVKRTYGGAQLYMILKRIMDKRTSTGIKGDDPLQFLMDQGDSAADVIQFVLGSLFAGQLNSGINAAAVLTYLAAKPYWQDRVREEVAGVAERYCTDSSRPLKEQLMQVPIEAWEGEFPIIDLCLKDSIRLQMSGTAFRKNISDTPIPINKEGTEVIPPGAYVTLAVGDIHYNPEIYSEADEWDPARYMPERAEDKKAEGYGWIGWGVARHPCLGIHSSTFYSWLSLTLPRHAICKAGAEHPPCLLRCLL
jgi:cytochrome P450